MMIAHRSPSKFPLGQVVATPGAIKAMQDSGEHPAVFLTRHAAGDWGEICQDDKFANDTSVAEGGRLLSVYKTSLGTRLWVITEADRSATTILLPDDY